MLQRVTWDEQVCFLHSILSAPYHSAQAMDQAKSEDGDQGQLDYRSGDIFMEMKQVCGKTGESVLQTKVRQSCGSWHHGGEAGPRSRQEIRP